MHNVEGGDLAESAERLREIIHDLEQSRAREAALRQQSDALLSGLNALVASDDVQAAFRNLLNVLSDAFEFDGAFVLDAPIDCAAHQLKAMVATEPAFADVALECSGPLARCRNGGVVILNDAASSPEWSCIPRRVRHQVRSVIMAPFMGRRRRGILVGVKSEPGFFSKRHRLLMERMRPLARHALQALEQRERLRDSLQRVGALVDGAPYGVLMIERDLSIGAQFSASCPDLLGREAGEIAGAPAAALLTETLRLDGERASIFRETLDICVGQNELNWELNAEHFPAEAVCSQPQSRMLDLIWTPMVNPETREVDSILLSMRDVTSEREMAAAIVAQDQAHAETMAALDALLQSPKDRLARFFAEAETRICWLEQALADPSAPQTRVMTEVHTLKGAARVLGLRELSAELHRFEDGLRSAEDGGRTSRQAWTPVRAAYSPLKRVFFEILGGPDGEVGAPSVAAIAEPHLADARAALQDLDVTLRVVIDDQLGPLSGPAAAALSTALQHLLPNMVDHSLAPARAADRRADAEIALRGERLARSTLITLRDDGAGFDLSKIRARAAARGLRLDPEDLLSVVFEPRFSTASATTERSGRGVGMTAARDAIAGAGGAVRLDNAPGGGSLITLELPPSAQGAEGRARRRSHATADAF